MSVPGRGPDRCGGRRAFALLFSLTTPYFLTPDNVLNILRQMSVIGVVGIGATLVILSAVSTSRSARSCS